MITISNPEHLKCLVLLVAFIFRQTYVFSLPATKPVGGGYCSCITLIHLLSPAGYFFFSFFCAKSGGRDQLWCWTTNNGYIFLWERESYRTVIHLSLSFNLWAVCEGNSHSTDNLMHLCPLLCCHLKRAERRCTLLCVPTLLPLHHHLSCHLPPPFKIVYGDE